MFKRMTTPFTRTALTSTMILALALGPAAGARAGTAAKAPAESAISITIDDSPEGERISFSAPGAPLDRVLGAIAEKAGFKLAIKGDLSQQPHAGRLSAVPLDRALRRLAGDTTMIVFFEPASAGGWRVAEVRLYARSGQ